jgi:hypothetical protein
MWMCSLNLPNGNSSEKKESYKSIAISSCYKNYSIVVFALLATGCLKYVHENFNLLNCMLVQ